MSTVSTSPASLFGGTWTQIKDKFLLAAGSTYAAGTTGGAAAVTLTTAQLAAHVHTNPGIPNNQSYPWAAPYQRVGYAYTADNPYPANVVTSSAGGGQAHNNMPPYEAVYAWKRVA